MLQLKSVKRVPLPPAVHKAAREVSRRLRETVGSRRQLGSSKPAAGGALGTVVLPFGRYFAAQADLLTREGFKSVTPIKGVSPFSGVGSPDPTMARYAHGERTNDRVQTEVHKDLSTLLSKANADYLVIDNSTALLLHREVEGRFYTIVSGEPSDLMDLLWNADPEAARAQAAKLSREGLTDHLRATYDLFIRACLENFSPDRIILVPSHLARFWVSDEGLIAPTNLDRRDARFVESLDEYFIEQTRCRVAEGTLAHFPADAAWHAFDHRLRRAIENDVVEICGERDGATARWASTHGRSAPAAADRVVGAIRRKQPIDTDWLTEYFTTSSATFDDLLALACLEQDGAIDDTLLRECVRSAVADPDSHPAKTTRNRFDRSISALQRWPWSPLAGLHALPRGQLTRSLRGWRWGSLQPPGSEPKRRPTRVTNLVEALRGWTRGSQTAENLWTPEITLSCGNVVFRFHRDGSIIRMPLDRLEVSDAEAVVDGKIAITPSNLLAVLRSWAVYFERGRRGLTSAMTVVVSDIKELVDTCSWIDWVTVLDNERVVVSNVKSATVSEPGPTSKTDLSFIFDPNNRIVTVGGGLMDQVTHIALYNELCRPYGFDYYLDDFRYTWWRSHNGFEASRLAPALESRRLSRLVSQSLIESFRDDVMKTRLPWLFNQSRTWYDLGLREATVITIDHVNSQRMMETEPEFPVHIYLQREELAELVREPPSPVCFFTTQQLIPLRPESAAAIGRVFSFHHLEARGIEPNVLRTAELLRAVPHVAFHVRRGDYLAAHFDKTGFNSQQRQYVDVIKFLIESELKTTDFNVAVFSDDLDFVESHTADYGLDLVTGTVRYMRGNNHFDSIYDAYLMSKCHVVVGSVGAFAATSSLLADPPSVFIRSRPWGITVDWRR